MPALVAPALPDDVLSRYTQPTLLADGLLLRPWQPRDADAVIEAFAAADIQHWHMRRIDGQAEALDWIASWADRWQANTDASWAVTHQAYDRTIGCASLRTLLPTEATAQVSYWVLPAARRTGAVARAARAVTRWGAKRSAYTGSTSLTPWPTSRPTEWRLRPGSRVRAGTLRGCMLHADG